MPRTGAQTLTRPKHNALGTLSDAAQRRERPARLKGRVLLNRAPAAIEAQPVDRNATSAINTMIVRAYYDSAINRRNLYVINTTHADDWTGKFGIAGQSSLHGRQANIERLASFIAEVPDAHFEIGDIRSMRDMVIVRFWLSGTQVGGPRSRRVHFRTPGIAIHQLERGRIREEFVVHPKLDRHARNVSGKGPKPTAPAATAVTEVWAGIRQGWIRHPYDLRNWA